MARLRRDGYLVGVVEKWNSFTRTRSDLFGIADLLALRTGETLAVQATSLTNVSHRVAKINANGFLPRLLDAGWRVQIHGWSRTETGRWTVRVVEIVAPTGADVQQEGMEKG